MAGRNNRIAAFVAFAGLICGPAALALPSDGTWPEGVLAVSLLSQQERYREQQVLDPNSDSWVNLTPLEPNTPEYDLAEARKMLAEGKGDDARRLLKNWIKANGENERLPEAHYLLGEAEFQRKRFWQAYEQYEIVADSASGDLFYKALRREMDVARAFMSGQKRIVWGFLPLPAYDDGAEICGKVWGRVPGTRLGEEALKLRADFHYDRGEFEIAQEEYASLAREYPSGRYVQLAMLRAAEAAAAAFPGVAFDDRSLINAQDRFEQLERIFPAFAKEENVGARLEAIREQRADKDLYVADWYNRTNRKGAAEFYYRLVIKDWPGTLADSQARLKLRSLGVEVAPGEEVQR